MKGNFLAVFHHIYRMLILYLFSLDSYILFADFAGVLRYSIFAAVKTHFFAARLMFHFPLLSAPSITLICIPYKTFILKINNKSLHFGQSNNKSLHFGQSNNSCPSYHPPYTFVFSS